MKKLLLPILLLLSSVLNAERLSQFDHVYIGSQVIVNEKQYRVLSIDKQSFDDKKRDVTVTTKFVICREQADNQYYLYKHECENYWAGDNDWYEFRPLSTSEYYLLKLKLNAREALYFGGFCAAYGYAMAKCGLLPLAAVQALVAAYMFSCDQWL